MEYYFSTFWLVAFLKHFNSEALSHEHFLTQFQTHLNNLQQFLPDLVLMVLEISVQPEPDLYPELNVPFLLELL